MASDHSDVHGPPRHLFGTVFETSRPRPALPNVHPGTTHAPTSAPEAEEGRVRCAVKDVLLEGTLFG